MRIRDAFPDVFRRPYPALDPKTQMFPAISLLRFHEIDALPIASEAGEGQRAVFGLSSLARLSSLKQGDFKDFLNRPCEEVSESLSSISADADLGELLDLFKKTKFGFARVDEKGETAGLVGLSDVLRLYEKGKIKTKLTAGDVASKVFALPGGTPLGRALQEMFEHRFRRVFVGPRSDSFISDRMIIAFVFDPRTLEKMSRGALKVLDTPIKDIPRMKARRVKASTRLAKAAAELRAERGQCLLSEVGLATPWDVVMKPWNGKNLAIAN